MPTYFKPVRRDEAGKVHSTIPNGYEVDPALVPVSSDVKNLITKDGTGVKLTAEDTVSQVENNAMRVAADNKLFVPTPAAGDFVSEDPANQISVKADGAYYNVGEHLAERQGQFLMADSQGRLYVELSAQAGNALRLGNDGKPYLPSAAARDLISSKEGNRLTLGDDAKLYVPEIVVGDILSNEDGQVLFEGPDGKILFRGYTVLDWRSGDEDNAIVLGEDGKLYVPKLDILDAVSECADNQLVLGCDGKLYISYGLRYDTASGQLDLVLNGDQVVSTVFILPDTSVLEDAGLIVNPPDQPEGTYIYLTFRLATEPPTTKTIYVDVSTLIDVYEAGNGGITITDNDIFLQLRDLDGPLKISEEVGARGLYLDYSELISGDTGNRIEVGDDGKLKVVGGGEGGVDAYIELRDTPDVYAPSGEQIRRAIPYTTVGVNYDEDGLQHYCTVGGTLNTFGMRTLGGTSGTPMRLYASEAEFENYKVVHSSLTPLSGGAALSIEPFAEQIRTSQTAVETFHVVTNSTTSSSIDVPLVLHDQVTWGPNKIDYIPAGATAIFHVYYTGSPSGLDAAGQVIPVEQRKFFVLNCISCDGYNFDPENVYHANLEFVEETAEQRFFIPSDATSVIMPLTSTMSDVGAATATLRLRLTATYGSQVSMTNLTLSPGTTTILTDQMGKHVTATVTAGWPSGATSLSLDLEFK